MTASSAPLRSIERPRAVGKKRRARVLYAAAGLTAFLLLWEAAPRLGLISHLLLPPPSVLPAAFWREITGGYWTTAVLASLTHYFLGLAIGTVLGIALGILTALSERLDASVSWIIRLLRPIPNLAWIPFAIVWFGITEAAATFIIVIGVMWINFYAAHGAARAIDKDLIEVADAFGHHSRLAKLMKIILPGATAGILAGVRTGLGQAWMAVMAAELFGIPGLGQRMEQASSLLATDVVVVYMVTIAGLYGLIDTLFVVLRDRLLRWQQ
jgi:NitT/TauT family transport system permease protein